MDRNKEQKGPLVLDLHAILRKRMPRKISRLVPDMVISWLARLIRQDELNEILRVTYPHRGSTFSRKVLDHLGITVDVYGLDRLPEGGRFMFASNHPLGGLDGISLIAVLGERYGDDGIRFVVNDMLMNVEPLRDVFIPVNKFGTQRREAAAAMNETLASAMHVLQFPAGLVSRLGKDGKIADLEWQKAFVTKAIEYERDIVPIHFIGMNTPRFYKTARWRKRMGLKINLEQALLPSEVCKAKGSHYTVIFGEPISWQKLKESKRSVKELAAEIKESVYNL